MSSDKNPMFLYLFSAIITCSGKDVYSIPNTLQVTAHNITLPQRCIYSRKSASPPCRSPLQAEETKQRRRQAPLSECRLQPLFTIRSYYSAGSWHGTSAQVTVTFLASFDRLDSPMVNEVGVFFDMPTQTALVLISNAII